MNWVWASITIAVIKPYRTVECRWSFMRCDPSSVIHIVSHTSAFIWVGVLQAEPMANFMGECITFGILPAWISIRHWIIENNDSIALEVTKDIDKHRPICYAARSLIHMEKTCHVCELTFLRDNMRTLAIHQLYWHIRSVSPFHLRPMQLSFPEHSYHCTKQNFQYLSRPLGITNWFQAMGSQFIHTERDGGRGYG